MVSILNNQELLTVAQAAAILGVTRNPVYDWSDATARKSAGKQWLETCLVGGRRKTTRECVQRFLLQEEPDEQAIATSINMDANAQAIRDLAML
jgi:hypothetical protein